MNMNYYFNNHNELVTSLLRHNNFKIREAAHRLITDQSKTDTRLMAELYADENIETIEELLTTTSDCQFLLGILVGMSRVNI